MESWMTYADANRYTRTDLICRVSYPDNPSTRPFSLYPLYAVKNGRYERVDEEAFPDKGSFTAMPTGSLAYTAASEIREQFGDVVVARMNLSSFNRNNSYDGSVISDQLLARFDLDNRQADASIRPFASSEVAKGLYQVCKVPDRAKIDFSKPFKRPVRLSAEAGTLYSPHIFLQQSGPNGPEFYGPFAYQLDSQGLMSLFASEVFDYRVYCLTNVPGSERITLSMGAEGDHASLATFLRRDYVDECVQRIDVEDAFDWLPSDRMNELFRSIINGSEKMKSFDSTVLKSLKSAILDYSASMSSVSLDGARRRRLEEAVDDMEESVLFNKEVLNQIFGRVDDEQLARIVTSEDVYPAIKDRLLASAGVKERLEEERRELECKIDALHEKAELAELACLRARDEEAEARANAQKTIDAVLGSKQDQIERLDAEIGEREAMSRAAQQQYERMVHSKMAVEEQIDNILANLNNEATTTGKILESEILRKVVRAINELNLKESEPVATAPVFIPTREDDMTPSELVKEIADRVTKTAGRNLNTAEVINMVTCLMQGYITTFSGLPGTGKTSMCRILAGALGLMNSDPAMSRFTEIDVEKRMDVVQGLHRLPQSHRQDVRTGHPTGVRRDEAPVGGAFRRSRGGSLPLFARRGEPVAHRALLGALHACVRHLP